MKSHDIYCVLTSVHYRNITKHDDLFCPRLFFSLKLLSLFYGCCVRSLLHWAQRAKIYGGEGVALGVTGPEVPHTDVTRIIADAAVL